MKKALTFAVLLIIVPVAKPVLCIGLNPQGSPSEQVLLAYVFPGNRLMAEDEIDATKLTHINYAFANIVNGRVATGHPTDSANLATLVRIREAHPHLKLLISVGGWTWSGNFSDMALSKESRAIFIESAVDFLEKYQLDGLDLDWEYPGLPGNNNTYRSEDKQNFTDLLLECRLALDAAGGAERYYMLTIAAGAFPDYTDNTEMAKIAGVLDLVNVMTYDFVGEWGNTTGHHTNLRSPADQPGASSVERSMALFLAEGVDREKLVIGAGFYGRGWRDVHPERFGLWQEGTGLTAANLSYNNLVRNYLSDPEFQQHWDESAAAPYLWNPGQRIFITYEDARSVGLKADYVKEQNFRGVMYWQYFSDYEDELLQVLAGKLLNTDSGFADPASIPRRPFPQGLNFPGTIKPTGITQETMDDLVASYYDYWKARYLRPGEFIEKSWFVQGETTGVSIYDKVTSEGHGWGMIITALMAGHDPEAREIFDGLVRMYNATRSVHNDKLMAWLITEGEDAGGMRGSAADGDLDVAYGLLLAHDQWGSDNGIDYLGLATSMINAGIKVSLIDKENMRIRMGDSQTMPAGTRSSDWMAGHFRSFHRLTGDPVFQMTADTIYALINHLSRNFAPETGLVPDFVRGNPPEPSGPNFLETEFDGTYNWNACRFPLRIAVDYAHHGTAAAKETLNRMLAWLKPVVDHDPAGILPGYYLGGAPIEGRPYTSMAFTAPFVAAGIADPKHAEWLSRGWHYISDKRELYYPDTINLLSLLMISGNWWPPGSNGMQ